MTTLEPYIIQLGPMWHIIAARSRDEAIGIWLKDGCQFDLDPEDMDSVEKLAAIVQALVIGVMTDKGQQEMIISTDQPEAPTCSVRVYMQSFVTEPGVIACSEW